MFNDFKNRFQSSALIWIWWADASLNFSEIRYLIRAMSRRHNFGWWYNCCAAKIFGIIEQCHLPFETLNLTNLAANNARWVTKITLNCLKMNELSLIFSSLFKVSCFFHQIDCERKLHKLPTKSVYWKTFLLFQQISNDWTKTQAKCVILKTEQWHFIDVSYLIVD